MLASCSHESEMGTMTCSKKSGDAGQVRRANEQIRFLGVSEWMEEGEKPREQTTRIAIVCFRYLIIVPPLP